MNNDFNFDNSSKRQTFTNQKVMLGGTMNASGQKSSRPLKMMQGCVLLFVIFCSALYKLTELHYFFWAWYLFQTFLLWLVADFITGVIHWWEDAYGNPKWPFLGKYVVIPNLVHHKHPTKLLENSYWNLIDTSFYAAAIVGGLLWLLGLHAWQIYLCLGFCTQGNAVHALSHRPDTKNSKIIRFLQKTGLLQSQRSHRWHHKAPYETNFCVMSEFVNSTLEKLKFWMRLEKFILRVFKLDVLRGSAVREGL